jgi:proline iminopeptidase
MHRREFIAMSTLVTARAAISARPGVASVAMKSSIGSSAESAKSSGVIAVEGAQLPYAVEGEGAPCIVIGSSIYYPRTLSRELRKHLKFAFSTSRHFAPSEASFEASRITIDTYSNDVEELRKTLGLGKVAVMGHSIHGVLALEYARRYPQSTSHVIVIASPPAGLAKEQVAMDSFWEADASPERKDALKRNLEKLGPDALSKLPPGERVIKYYVTNGPKYWYDYNYDASWLWQGMHVNGPVFNRVLGELFKDYDLAQGPGAITSPVFLALGRYDYVVPYTLWNDQEKSKLSKLSYDLFAKSGHTPQLEEPDLFDHKLLEWLRSNR